MAYFRRDNELNMDQVAAFLKDAVEKVNSSPDELEELRKVFKKNVPLTRRSWVAAFLIKQASGSIYRFSGRKNREEFARDGRANREGRESREGREDFRRSRFEKSEEKSSEGRDSFEHREPHPRVQIDPESAATVFVGIGRNRRTFPRDIVGLFTNVGGVERERIGDIRVLANYSFVQLFKEDADKAIEALNGFSYRGRPLSVSYSKQNDGASASEPLDSTLDSQDKIPNVSNESSGIRDSYSMETSETVAEQAAFAKAQSEMSDEEILAARAPRSSSSSDIQ